MLNKITICQIPFEFADNIDPFFIDGDYKKSFPFIADSQLLTRLEPYLLRSMKTAQGTVTDPDVLENLIAFTSAD